MKKNGRPPKQIDFEKLELLCKQGCTAQEVSSVLGVNTDTLNKKIKIHYKKEGFSTFSDVFNAFFAHTKASLRSAVISEAMGCKAKYDSDGNLIQEARRPNTSVLLKIFDTYLKPTEESDITPTDKSINIILQSK